MKTNRQGLVAWGQGHIAHGMALRSSFAGAARTASGMSALWNSARHTTTLSVRGLKEASGPSRAWCGRGFGVRPAPVFSLLRGRTLLVQQPAARHLPGGVRSPAAAYSSASSTAAEAGVRLTSATASELRRQLEARAEAGDADAQFKLGVLYCFGNSQGTSGCSNHAHSDGDEGKRADDAGPESPVIDPASLDFLIGPGYVVPKDQSEGARITNWREWLKEERRKLKAKGTKPTEAADQGEASFAPNYAMAAKWFHQSAKQGHPLAQHFFAIQLLRGLGVDQDVEEATKWLSRSASSGNSLSLYELGQLYYDGQLVPQDMEKSHNYFLQAADLDNSGAQFWIGYCYHQGLNVNRSIEQALSYLEKAAKQKHPSALYYLGMMHLAGDGVERSPQKAVSYFSASAAEGEAEAAYCLGSIYFNGDGVDVDYRKALQYYHEAARKGHADAMCCEGVMYFRGLGTEQDDEKAFYAYQAAAMKGHAPSCRNLAYMYQHGRGCAKSDTNAEYFLRLADQLESQQQEQKAKI